MSAVDVLVMARPDGSPCCGGYGVDAEGRATCFDCAHKDANAPKVRPWCALCGLTSDDSFALECPHCGAPAAGIIRTESRNLLANEYERFGLNNAADFIRNGGC